MPATRSVRSYATNGGGRGGGGGPPSPTLTATTHASMDFPHRPSILVTRADLRASVQAYEHVLQTCKAYTNAMLVLSGASADFAAALEECSKVKGAHEEADKLQACSGLHYLMSNYSQVLANSFWKDFQIPLLESFDTYRQACNERQLLHEKQILEKSKILKETEAKNIKLGSSRKKGEQGRDLNSFRRALAELQRQVDELDELKADYYHEVLDAEQEMWSFIQSKVSLIVRSQLEISDRISSKGLSDPVLEPILSSIPDPFGSYGPPKTDDQIFSILPPTSLLGLSNTGTHTRESSESGGLNNSRHAVEGASGDKANLKNGSAHEYPDPSAGAAAAGAGNADGKDTETFGTRSHSLFGTLRYEDGREDADDDFLSPNKKSSSGLPSESKTNAVAIAAAELQSEKAATIAAEEEDASSADIAAKQRRNAGSSSDRAKHTLSIIREDASAAGTIISPDPVPLGDDKASVKGKSQELDEEPGKQESAKEAPEEGISKENEDKADDEDAKVEGKPANLPSIDPSVSGPDEDTTTAKDTA